MLFRPPNTGRDSRVAAGRAASTLSVCAWSSTATRTLRRWPNSDTAGRGATNLVYVTVSTGVGGAVILDDRLLRGALGVAGELGHISVSPDGPSADVA